MAITIPKDANGVPQPSWMNQADRISYTNQMSAPAAPAAPSYQQAAQSAPAAPAWQPGGGAVVYSNGSTNYQSTPTVTPLTASDYKYTPTPAGPASYNMPINQSWSQPTGGNAPASAAPAAPATSTRVNPLTGATQQMSDEDYKNLLDQAAEAKRQQGVVEQQAQFALDTARATQVAAAAYQQAMEIYNNATLAAQIADNAMKNDIAKQQTEQTATANAANAAYQTGQLGVAQAGQVSSAAYQQGQNANAAAGTANAAQYQQQTIAQNSLDRQQTARQKRPYRALRVSVA